MCRSGKARRSLVNTSFSACAPVASTGSGVRISTSASTTSSIVVEMSSASPVLTASCRRRNVALLFGMWPLLGSVLADGLDLQADRDLVAVHDAAAVHRDD